MKLITNNLYLEWFVQSDVTEPYIDALNDPQVNRLTEARHKLWNENNVYTYVVDSQFNGELFGIFLKDTHKHIGNIRISNVDKHNRRCELGLMIWDKKQWGKGYAYESMTAIIDYCFKQLGMHKVMADYYAVNIASHKLFTKLKFNREGIFRDHFFLEGEWIDSIRVSKIKE